MTQFGFCAPIFASAGGFHQRTPLVETVDYDVLERKVQEAEALGYDSVWIADHLILGREGFILEGYTVMAALARVTKRIRLGSIHFANRFRPPSITAKMISTLDFISNGRVEFFFDPYAGDRPDAEAYGLHVADEAESFDRFEEAIGLIKRLWSQDKVTHAGRYYSLDDAICEPKPVQKPVPLWIGTFGGGGTPEKRQRTSNIIATHADWWNITPASRATVKDALDVLRQACDARGRDYSSIRKSLETQILIARDKDDLRRWQERIMAANPNYGDWDELSERFIIGDVETVTRRIEDYVALGIDCFMFWFMDYPASDGLRLVAENILPKFRSEANSSI
jgi:alkanesulfonate monooxygenase SsuD/methylene tetrahydromethanopterin reductase-like flavin-dependent oxidoreductase (luciferase family)